MLIFLLTFIISCSLAVANQAPSSINDVIERLQIVEEKLREGELEIQMLRETSAVQKELIRKQEIRINDQDLKINNQEIKIKALEKEIDDLNTVVASTRATHLSNKRSIKQLYRQSLPCHSHEYHKKRVTKNKVTSIDESVGDASEKVPRQSMTIGGGIAFTAYLNHDVTFGAGQTIKFNQIITNDGNGFNTHTGVFTCPEGGMYLFTFFVGERSDTDSIVQIYADLIVNSQNVIDAVAETSYNKEDSQGGNTVVFRLKLGDSVWVRSRRAGYHIEGDSSRITSFTGLYLYP